MKLFIKIVKKCFSKHKRKYILSSLLVLITAVGLAAAAFAQAGIDFNLLADDVPADNQVVFDYTTNYQVGNSDDAFGRITLTFPEVDRVINEIVDSSPFDEDEYYGNPDESTVSMRLDQGFDVNGVYDQEYEFDTINEPTGDGLFLKTNELRDSLLNKTYYMVEDETTISYDYDKLWDSFLSYVRERLTDSAFWGANELQIPQAPEEADDPEAPVERYLFARTERVADAVTRANLMQEELNGYVEEFMASINAYPYDSRNGIQFENMANQKAANVTAIKVRIPQISLAYEEYANVGTETETITTTYQEVPIVMFSVDNFHINFSKPNGVPIAETYSKQPITQALTAEGMKVFNDEAVALTFSNNDNPEQQLMYKIYETDYPVDEVDLMGGWELVGEGEYINLLGSNFSDTVRYLYVKTGNTEISDSVRYRDSEVTKYKFEMGMTALDAEISISVKTADGSQPPADGKTAVDVGDTVEMGTVDGASILYTTDGKLPDISLYSPQSGGPEINKLNAAAGKNKVFFYEGEADYNYLLLNRFWYRCDKAVKLYKEAIKIDETVRIQNRLPIIAIAIMDGYEMSSPYSETFAYELKRQVSNPVSDIQTSDDNPTPIDMGSTINFSNSTIGSEIFYTTNGSAPVVTTQTDAAGKVVTIPGNDYTKKYDLNSALTITESLADYGTNVTFMVKAVNYSNGIQVMKDSEVVRFIYRVNTLPQADIVSSIPTTELENQTVVTVGSKIMLYCKTPGSTIYYTIDGTEPVIGADGKLAKNTKRYNPTKGITVPKQTDVLFTITAVAHAQGYTPSEVVRLVFRYPDAVSAPYAVPGSGVVGEHTPITLRSSTEGAVIYYEQAFDGQTPKNPTQKSSVYDPENPIIITRQTTIKTMAVSGGVSSVVNTFAYTVSSKLTMPTASLPNGSVIPSGTTLTLNADQGASIYYTIDGSNPADSENTNVNIGNKVLLEGDAGNIVTIRAYAAKEGFSNSEIGIFSYSFSNYAEAIFADKESGTVVRNGETVKLNTDVSNAVIYYTTDGSMPTTASSYGDTVVIEGQAGGTVTLKAIAIVPGSAQMSAAATFTYTIMRQLHAPTSNVPTNAVFTEEGQVILSAEEGTIYYTTDGSVPTVGSSAYIESITISQDTTIKAIAVSDEADTSDVSTFVYQFASQVEMPTVSHESGELTQNTEITLASATPEAAIYYTTNGTDPDMDDKADLNVYTGPIMIDKATTIKAVATKSGMKDSMVLTVGYTVRPPIVKEEEKKPSNYVVEDKSGRLVSRSTYAGENTGPSFNDILLRNAAYGILVASKFDIIPDESSLNVDKTNTTQAARNMVKQELGEYYNIVSSYDITLNVEGEEIQPDGTIEIGIPITSEYENGIVHVVHMEEDGTIEVQETRRSGGMAYAKVSKLSEYSIAAPELPEEKKGNLFMIVLSVASGVVLLGGIIFFVVRRRIRYYDR